MTEKMMRDVIRVEYDGDIFERQRVGGISRFFAKLIETYRRNPSLEIEPVLNFSWSRNMHLQSVGSAGVRTIRQNSPADYRRFCSMLNGAASLFNPREQRDIVHLTFYDRATLIDSSPLPVVMTVHDMIPETHPHLCTPNAHGEKINLINECTLISCVSRATQRELAPYVTAKDAKVRVCHHGVDHVINSFVYSRDQMSRKVLYIGDRHGYKDFPVLLRALRHLSGVELQVVCVGGGHFTAEEVRMIADLPPSVAVVQRHLSDKELDDEFRSATAFVATSLVEGFGLPILEAMARGCPCILSDTSIFREVAGDCAVFFEPGSDAELAEAIRLILSDSDLHEDLSVGGWNRSLHFSWEKTAREMANLYKALV
jgi:glycosyltransferase involved in cell wall biosynthesis